MTAFKKIIALCLVCACLVSLISCVEYHPAGGIGGSNDKKPGGNSGDSTLDDDPTNDFTVQLVYRSNGKPFIPGTAVNVYWKDGYNVHIASVDENGRAIIDGLDGDYNVTLSSVPDGYAYDSNAYTANNFNRNIVIEMWDLNLLRGKDDNAGVSYLDAFIINGSEDYEVYTVTLNSENDLKYIRYSNDKSGTYIIESWVGITEDEVSPLCYIISGNSHFEGDRKLVTDVGACGSYTRNFIHTVKIADENISSGGGSATFTFAVGAETKSGVYPVNVTFAIKREGDYAYDRTEQVIIMPEHDWSGFDFEAFDALAGGKIVGAETLISPDSNSYVFDEDNYKIWNVSEGGDGVYHVYNPEKYPETNGYGPMLVAYITSPFEYLSQSDPNVSFATIEDAGNNALVIGSKYNYRGLIKGIGALAAGGYYCTSDCFCHLDGSTPICPLSCTECPVGCNKASDKEMSLKGYAELVNADGVAPVTKELKEFLQMFVSNPNSSYYFKDGEGTIEEDFGIDSYEDSQWLFACGYYK